MTQDPSSDPVDDLLADCLAAADPEAALAAAAQSSPEHADELQKRWRFLLAAGAPVPAPPPRDQLGPYRLLQPLGGGGMGVVYRAVDTRTDRDVALKLVRPEQLWFAGARQRFHRELETLRALAHPGIVPVLDGGEHDGVPFLAMEYAPGRSLATALADPPPPAAERTARACRIALQVAEALVHAHGRGIVHRDVKPSNIMLDADDRARIIDFGLARNRHHDTMTQSGVQPGSLAYMSPEQARGEAVDGRTDVWSLGLVLIELLTGAQPFAAATEAATRQRVLTAALPAGALGPLPPPLRAVLATALAPEPARRYAGMAAFAADLRAVLAGTEVAARAPGPLLRLRRHLRRRPAASAMIALAAVLFVVLPTTLLLHERAARQEIAREAERARLAESAARSTATFLEQLFDEAEPGERRGDKAPIRELLARGARRLRQGLQDDPPARARLLARLGAVTTSLGLWRDAEALLREALDLPQPDAATRRELQLRLAQALSGQERHQEAVALRRDRLAAWTTPDAATDAAVLRNGLAVDLWHLGDEAAAAAEFAAAEAALATLLPADAPPLLRARLDAAECALDRDGPDAVRPRLQAVLAAIPTARGADDTLRLRATELLARAEADGDQPAAAAARLRTAVAAATDLLDADHPTLAQLRETLAYALLALGQPRQGLPLVQQALQARRAVFGNDHPVVGRSRALEAELAFEGGDLPLASEAAGEALRIYEAAVPDGNRDFATLLDVLARIRTVLGDPAAGVRLAQRALAMHARFDRVRPQATVGSQAFLAYAQALRGEAAEAARSAAAAVAAAAAGNARTRFLAAATLVDTLLVNGDLEAAAAALPAAEQAQVRSGTELGAAWCAFLAGWLAEQRGDPPAAEAALQRALALQERLYPADHPYLARSLGLLGQVLASQGKFDRALPLLERAVAIRRAAGAELYLAWPLLQLAGAHQQRNDAAQAWPLVREALQILVAQQQARSRLVKPGLQLGLWCATHTGDAGRSATCRTELLALVAELLPPEDFWRRTLQLRLGR